MRRSRLTIFEGPDGAGKTTASRAFAEATGARYHHHGVYAGLGHSALANIYVESMLPALRGERDVVLDRSWLSEAPYGEAFRGGDDRLGTATCRMLDRLALSCSTLLVSCQPAWETIRENFLKRKGLEYLDSVEQLQHVYERYAGMHHDLPTILHNYQQSGTVYGTDSFRSEAHPVSLSLGSAGTLAARVLLVGESFGPAKPGDHQHRWPFASWSSAGCSRWLTEQLEAAKLNESDLLWANADTEALPELVTYPDLIIALGVEASAALEKLGADHQLMPHPQFWKRFNVTKPYPLIDFLESL